MRALFSPEILQAGAVVNRSFPLYKDTVLKKKLQVFFQTIVDGVFVTLCCREARKRAHSKQGAVPYVSVKKKQMVGEVE